MPCVVRNRPDPRCRDCHLLGLLLGLALSFAALAKNGDSPEANHPQSRDTSEVFTISIASSRNAVFNRFFANRLREKLGAGYTIKLLLPEADQPVEGDLVIALGASALHRSMQIAAHPPLLALLVSNDTYASYTNQQNASKNSNTRANQTALFSDPPLLRQALLGLQVLPQATRVAILARPDRAQEYQSLASALLPYGLKLRVFTVDSMDHLVATLIRALDFGDFLLGTPDRDLYNRQTIKPILLTTYRQNRILIGPEAAFVKAGALASTYTPASALTDQTVSVIQSFRSSGRLPETDRIRRFKVKFNQQVANSLNIVLPAPAAVVRKLKAAESLKTNQERRGGGR